MDQEELEALSLEPWAKKTLRQDLPIYMDSDEELNKLLLKKSNSDTIIDYCDRVLKELNQRTWQLKSFIDWERYISGK